jgi:hypothetical protein
MNNDLTNFIKAFRLPIGSFQSTCDCGKEYYNPDYSWDITEEELDKLDNNPNAFAVDHSVGSISFGHNVFVDACECWHSTAYRIINWMDEHARQIAEYFKYEKESKKMEYENSVTIE